MSPATSDRKIEANRLNAARSTGPSTPEGKLASSCNAIAHGLTSAHPILPGEDPAEFSEFVQSYRDTYRPAGRLIRELVDELAGLRWCLRRVPIVESLIIRREMDAISREPEFAGREYGQILATAYERLIERKVLNNLLNQEARLNSRVDKIQKALAAIERIQTRPNPLPQFAPPQPEPQRPTQPILKNEPIRLETHPSRNAACSCGSGLKFKRCCLNPPAVKAAAA